MEINHTSEKVAEGEKMKEVTGVIKVPSTEYYIQVGKRQIEVPKKIYNQIMYSLANGDYWVFDEENQTFIKYGTQLNLFEDRNE